MAIGIFFGLLSAYVLKKFRLFSKKPIMETIIIIGFGYMGYGFAELTHNSGILALLTTGIIMSHYTWYNLSP